MFGILVIAYLFLGGASSGAFLVMSAWSLGFHRGDVDRQPLRLRQAFETLKTRVYAIALAMLVVSMLCLQWDLLYPERALLLFLRPRPTALSFGAYALAALAFVGLLLVAANAFDLPFLGARVRKILEALCCVCSVAVMLYTGLFLASHGSVAFWNTWTLPLLFFFSALSGGISTVLLVNYFVQDQTILLRATRPLQKAHVACLAAEAVCLALFVGAAATSDEAAGSTMLLLEPNMLSTALVGAVGMGIAAPFALEVYALAAKEYRSIPVSDAVCLMGGFFLRYCVVMCGTH